MDSFLCSNPGGNIKLMKSVATLGWLSSIRSQNALGRQSHHRWWSHVPTFCLYTVEHYAVLVGKVLSTRFTGRTFSPTFSKSLSPLPSSRPWFLPATGLSLPEGTSTVCGQEGISQHTLLRCSPQIWQMLRTPPKFPQVPKVRMASPIHDIGLSQPTVSFPSRTTSRIAYFRLCPQTTCTSMLSSQGCWKR